MQPKDWVQHSKYKHLYQRINGTWYFVRRVNGKLVRKSTKTNKISEAVKVAQEIENSVRKQQDSVSHFKKIKKFEGVTDPKLSDLWNEFKSYKFERVGRSTQMKYNTSWNNHLVYFWGDKNLSDVDLSNIESWGNWFIRNRAGITYFNIRKHLTTFFKWMFKNGFIGRVFELENLDKSVLNRINKRATHAETYTKSEVNDFLKSECYICSLPIKIALTMGARKSEILTLKKDAIYTNQDGIFVIKFWSYKNKKYREVPVPKLIKTELKLRLKNESPSNYLFPGIRDKSKPMSSQVLDRYFAEMKIQINIKKRKTFHDLRRTFATMTAENGWPPVTACRILDMSLEVYDSVYCKPSISSMSHLMAGVEINKYKAASAKIEVIDGE